MSAAASPPRDPLMRSLPLVGALLAAADLVAYAALLAQQHAVSDEPRRVPFVMGVIASIAAAALLATLSPLRAARTLLLVFGGVSGLALGFVGMFSIGLPLLAAGVVLLVAAATPRATGASANVLQWVAGATVAIAVVGAGLPLTA